MRFSIALLACALASGGPVDFGLAELDSALASRNLKWKVKYELNLEGPGSYRIEPYGYGGGHVTGGDLRGLMYGLLEAADQVRATGRLSLAHSTPAIPLRGVHMFVENGDLTHYTEDFWQGYFQSLARGRLNRFTLILLSSNPYALLLDVKGFPDEPGSEEQRTRNLEMLRVISQTAASYAVDFTLGFWGIDDSAQSARYDHDAMLKLLAECPLIRSVEMRPDASDHSDYRDTIFKALHEVGRRVALEPRGMLLDPDMQRAAHDSGVALRLSSDSWPPGFEIDAPPGAGHALFYWIWGRTAYDPKTKPPRTVPPEEYRSAALAVAHLRNALLSDPSAPLWPEIPAAAFLAGSNRSGSDFVASPAEAVENRLDNVASAKFTPLEIADSLSADAAVLAQSAIPDFQLLAELARYHAHRLRAAYDLALFDQRRNPTALDRASAELKEAADAWKSSESSPSDVHALESDIEHRRAETPDPSALLPDPFPTSARPQIAHLPVKMIAAGQPITLTIQITPSKDVRIVRLHYRTVGEHVWKTIDKAPGSLVFPIPAADLAPDSQLVYYFEILNRENTGWFEPDPVTAIPYHWVRVQPK